jgi:hypothetical protein
MQASQEELISTLDELTSAIGEVLASHLEIRESILGLPSSTVAAKVRISQLQAKIDGEKVRLAKAKEAERRKRELLRKNRENDRRLKKEVVARESRSVPVRDGSGKTIGFVLRINPQKTEFRDSKGRLVAYELGGRTYDGKGRFRGTGDQGLRFLGCS